MPESRARKGPLQPRCRVLRADEARDSDHAKPGRGACKRCPFRFLSLIKMAFSVELDLTFNRIWVKSSIAG